MFKPLFGYFIFALAFISSQQLFAQTVCPGDTASDRGFTTLGDSSLNKVYSDGDNGDGVGDGALLLVGHSESAGLGAAYQFNCQVVAGTNLSISTTVYNPETSYVALSMVLYNMTDDVRLAELNGILVRPGKTNQIAFDYTTQNSDENDQLELRYMRADDNRTLRRFAIDNASINGYSLKIEKYVPVPTCSTPLDFDYDIALQTVSHQQVAEVEKVYHALSDFYVPTPYYNLSKQLSDYDQLNIVVSNGQISGDDIGYYDAGGILKAFVRYLKFVDPGNTAIAEKATRLVWLVAKNSCEGKLGRDFNAYGYRQYASYVAFLKDYLPEEIKVLFGYTLQQHSDDFKHFWGDYEEGNGYNTDWIYNIADSIVLYGITLGTASDAEKVRWLQGAKRFLERFLTYSNGAAGGIKPDGTGFHHAGAYDGYMYAFTTLVRIVSALDDTSFQIDVDAYKRLRDLIYAQRMFSNDFGIKALSMTGRNPHSKTRSTSQEVLRLLAISGGKILGLTTADPLLAGYYNRVAGNNSNLDYSQQAEFEPGFFQFNHANAGVFRKLSNTGKGDWLAVFKGFNNGLWGAELYTSDNRYGRYQSYGAMEIIYPGDNSTGNNGFGVETWDWNFNPGATTIVLPWSLLHGERGRIDELQQKQLAGSLAHRNLGVGKDVLTNTYGSLGMFAMDFQENSSSGGWSVIYGPNTHNGSFRFKKSRFAFSDVIVALGSDIANNDLAHPTVTTLYQRTADTNSSVQVNDTAYHHSGEIKFAGDTEHWVIDDYQTGFYLYPGSGELTVWKGEQQTPNENQPWPVDISQNATGLYTLGYIDHGRAPDNAAYEYMVVPNANALTMRYLGEQKPYTVHEKSSARHVVYHLRDKVWGYALFEAANDMSYQDSVVQASSGPGLVMYSEISSSDILLSVADPYLGFGYRDSSKPAPTVLRLTLHGEWSMLEPHQQVTRISFDNTSSTLEFTLKDGLPVELRLRNPNRVNISQADVADQSGTGGGNINALALSDSQISQSNSAQSNLFPGGAVQFDRSLTKPKQPVDRQADLREAETDAVSSIQANLKQSDSVPFNVAKSDNPSFFPKPSPRGQAISASVTDLSGQSPLIVDQVERGLSASDSIDQSTAGLEQVADRSTGSTVRSSIFNMKTLSVFFVLLLNLLFAKYKFGISLFS